jgi:L-glyceraldehyde 3-phosphate reductase
MKYNFCGRSGLQLPAISLGMWHNFGDGDDPAVARAMILHAFEQGITHFDLANNYGPPPGSAEVNVGKILASDLKNHRDELIVSSKAGHRMWNGPYGDGGSRKSLMASIDQSLRRTGLDYFDIFYSHRYDPQTPVEETAQALIDIVRSGKALYAGLSKYPPEQAKIAYGMMRDQHVPCLIDQDRFNLIDRGAERMFELNREQGVGFIAFSPLAQGLLTGRYLNGIPAGSRATKSRFLKTDDITGELLDRLRRLNELAAGRGQTLAEMSLAWVLNHPQVTSVIVGSSSVAQLQDNIDTLKNTAFSDGELARIDEIFNR